jgi:hypothetical protein
MVQLYFLPLVFPGQCNDRRCVRGPYEERFGVRKNKRENRAVESMKELFQKEVINEKSQKESAFDSIPFRCLSRTYLREVDCLLEKSCCPELTEFISEDYFLKHMNITTI